MPIKFRRVVGQVLSISSSKESLQVEVECTKPRFLLKPELVVETFYATGSVARTLVHWIYVGGVFDFQIEEGTNQIIGISVVR